jgi:hypothetical protein
MLVVALNYGLTFTPNTLILPTCPYVPNSQPQDAKLFKISRKLIVKAISKLKNHSACGPDDISSKLLKLASVQISLYLKNVYQICLNNSVMPKEWKQAIVIPIFKCGQRSKPANYRPISLTCIPCKIYEKLICTYFTELWGETHFLSPFQFGFRNQHSCEASLAGLTQRIINSIDKDEQVDAILLDMSKAFDVVPHDLLIEKLSAMKNVDQRLVIWIREYLFNRTQQVKVDDVLSDHTQVSSGVPQGSVLGPQLFLIFINGIAENMKCAIRLYADDCILYHTVKSIEDCKNLQCDLNTAQCWISENGMKLNVAKTQRISFKRTLKGKLSFDYTINGNILVCSNSCKYLGVICDSKLSWDEHIQSTVKKANRRLQFVMRNLKKGTVFAREKAYQTMVRPILEYCSSIWDPNLICNIQAINKIQRKAIRLVLRNHDSTVSNTALQLQRKWESLPLRRQRSRLIAMFKIFHNETAWSDLHSMTSPPTRSNGRLDHPYKIQVPSFKTSVGLHSLLSIGIRNWNALPLTGLPDSSHKFSEGIAEFQKLNLNTLL